MFVNGKQYKTIWLSKDKNYIEIIDQRYLPFKFVIEKISTYNEMAIAIKDMHLRGAPLIGAAAGYGIYLAALEAENNNNFDQYIRNAAKLLEKTRPTAINLKWAINRQLDEISKESNIKSKIAISLEVAEKIAHEDINVCKKIGKNGVMLIKQISKKKNGKPVEILTHCNAGALACVDLGTATSSIYEALTNNIPIHVWVDETRPRNQGKLTAWELQQQNIPNTIICDNTGGYLMQKGKVDIVIVGTDRTTPDGDVVNKIGTYLKALAASDNNIPFYVALPLSSIDWNIENGASSIPIEERSEEEVLYIEGMKENQVEKIRLFSEKSKACNYGFDITPARLITGFITEKGISKPDELRELFGRYIV